MNKRYYPVSEEFFTTEIFPIIKQFYSAAGRPPKVSFYQVFCATLFLLRTGTPWRDLPQCYGYWHTIYLRFKRGADRGLWWNILFQLQQTRKLKMAVVMADSTTIPLHRHGGDSKGGSTA